MKIFNFALAQKLVQHFREKFHSDSDGNGFNAQKPLIDPLNGLTPKMEFFNLVLEQKLDRHSCA